MYIAPNIKNDQYLHLNLDDASSPGWNRAIEIFDLRIKSRYLEPIDFLIKEDEKRDPVKRRYGFTILAIDCLLIETLQAFREGLPDTKGKSKDMFVRFLTQRKHFKPYFSTQQAERFYCDFRCGILHQAEVMGDSLLWSVGMVRGEKADGTPYINRTEIHDFIRKEIALYCDELKNNNKEIRKSFKTKMDFIARK